jgi:cytochrome c oxidase subunit 3
MAMVYAGIIGAYVAQRSGASGAWFPDTVTIPLSPPNIAAVTLLLSVVAIHWAHYSIRNDDRPNGYVALGLTLLFGLAYINSAIYLFTQMGAAIDGTTAEFFLFAIGGFHITTFVGGIVFVALMAFRTLGGQYSGRDAEGISAAALYWDVAVVLYLVSWLAVYVTK